MLLSDHYFHCAMCGRNILFVHGLLQHDNNHLWCAFLFATPQIFQKRISVNFTFETFSWKGTHFHIGHFGSQFSLYIMLDLACTTVQSVRFSSGNRGYEQLNVKCLKSCQYICGCCSWSNGKHLERAVLVIQLWTGRGRSTVVVRRTSWQRVERAIRHQRHES